jgi:hypothetical protein
MVPPPAGRSGQKAKLCAADPCALTLVLDIPALKNIRYLSPVQSRANGARFFGCSCKMILVDDAGLLVEAGFRGQLSLTRKTPQG